MKGSLFAVFVSIILLMVSTTQVVGQDYGPRHCDGLIVKWHGNVEEAYSAMKMGDVDALGYELTSDLYHDAIEDPNICVGPVGDMGRYQIDINNNCTIPDYEGIESPTYGKKRAGFRKALALLFDKDRVIDECCGGFANRNDQPIGYVHRGWRNPACWYEDGTYQYEYDPAAAVAMLDAEGFTQGSTPNPSYDPGVPYSSPNLRVYPPDHPQKAGLTLDPIKFCIRTDDLRRTCAGDLLAAEMDLVGLPLNRVYGPSSELYPVVMDAINYHIYTGGWSVGRFPPLYVYGTYHASQFFLGGSNYVTGGVCPWDATEPDCLPPEEDPSWIGPYCANYPELDRLLEASRYPTNFEASKAAFRNALWEFSCNQCVILDMFSARSYWAWRSELGGVVLNENTGLENGLNFLSWYKTTGGPIVYGLTSGINEMNIVYIDWYYDCQVLERWNDGGGIFTAPYDQSIHQPGCLLSWNTTAPSAANGTLVTQLYRNNSWFLRPITGEPIQNVGTDTLYKSLMYYAQHSTAWVYTSVQDIHTARMFSAAGGCPGIELHFDTKGYWNTYYGTTFWLADEWFMQPRLGNLTTETVSVDAHGHLNLDNPVFWVEEITDNTLTESIPHWNKNWSNDGWRIQKKNPDHSVWWNMDVNVGVPRAGHTVTVTYWYTGTAASIAGFWPGNNPWQNVAIGCGMFYLVEFVPGSGGWATFECNPLYQLETPLMGEVDFVWKPDGCFKVDIFDIVMAASAYGSQGTGEPDEDWFPGADLAPPRGIDIFDIVTITSVYGETFDCCPCPDY